jgi:hypothetical protein
MDAASILDRVRTLRIEVRELQELNTRYRERRNHHTPAEIASSGVSSRAGCDCIFELLRN